MRVRSPACVCSSVVWLALAPGDSFSNVKHKPLDLLFVGKAAALSCKSWSLTTDNYEEDKRCDFSGRQLFPDACGSHTPVQTRISACDVCVCACMHVCMYVVCRNPDPCVGCLPRSCDYSVPNRLRVLSSARRQFGGIPHVLCRPKVVQAG